MADCSCASEIHDSEVFGADKNGVCTLHVTDQLCLSAKTFTVSAAAIAAQSPNGIGPNNRNNQTLGESATPNSEGVLAKRMKLENSGSDDNSDLDCGAENSAAKLVLMPRSTIVKRVLSIHEKLEICERAKTGEKKTKLAREYGVQPPAITKVVQNEQKWQAFMASNGEAGGANQAENGTKKRGRKRARQVEAGDGDGGRRDRNGGKGNCNGNGAGNGIGIDNGNGSVCTKQAIECEKSDCDNSRLSLGLRLERSLSVPSENGFGTHSWMHDGGESASGAGGELSSSFSAAIGGARMCLEVLTRLNANLVAQAAGATALAAANETGKTDGATAAATNGQSVTGTTGDGSAPINIVPVHWFHALFQIEHFFSLLVQQQSQLDQSQ